MHGGWSGKTNRNIQLVTGERKIRVLVYQGYASGGGSKRSLWEQVKVLRAIPEVELIVVCSKSGWFTERLVNNRVPYEYFRGLEALPKLTADMLRTNPALFLWRFFKLLPQSIRLWIYLTGRQADLAIINESRDFWPMLPFLLRKRPVSIFNSMIETELQSFHGRLVCRLADYVFTVSEAVYEPIAKWRAARSMGAVRLVQLIVDTETEENEHAGHDLRAELNISPKTVLIGMVAAIHPRKGQMDTLKIFRELAFDNNDLHFIIAGSVTSSSSEARQYEEALLQSAARSGISERIHFLGWREDVSRWLDQLDVHLMPTRREGLPRIGIECLRAGVPIVSYDLPSMREVVVNESTGYLVPVGDLLALKQMAAQIIAEPQLRKRLSEASHAYWKDNFSPEKLVEQTRDAFKDVIANIK